MSLAVFQSTIVSLSPTSTACCKKRSQIPYSIAIMSIVNIAIAQARDPSVAVVLMRSFFCPPSTTAYVRTEFWEIYGRRVNISRHNSRIYVRPRGFLSRRRMVLIYKRARNLDIDSYTKSLQYGPDCQSVIFARKDSLGGHRWVRKRCTVISVALGYLR